MSIKKMLNKIKTKCPESHISFDISVVLGRHTDTVIEYEIIISTLNNISVQRAKKSSNSIKDIEDFVDTFCKTYVPDTLEQADAVLADIGKSFGIGVDECGK